MSGQVTYAISCHVMPCHVTSCHVVACVHVCGVSMLRPSLPGVEVRARGHVLPSAEALPAAAVGTVGASGSICLRWQPARYLCAFVTFREHPFVAPRKGPKRARRARTRGSECRRGRREMRDASRSQTHVETRCSGSGIPIWPRSWESRFNWGSIGWRRRSAARSVRSEGRAKPSSFLLGAARAALPARRSGPTPPRASLVSSILWADGHLRSAV